MSAISDFVAKLYPIAKAVEAETGLSARLGVAEASEESNYGRSALAVPGTLGMPGTGGGNNLFGMTAELGTYWRSQGRPFVLMPTHEWVAPDKVPAGVKVTGKSGDQVIIEIVRPFRAYASWAESYRDWARLMQINHYVDAGATAALKNDDARAFGTALDAAGYASDANYGQKIAARADLISSEIIA